MEDPHFAYPSGTVGHDFPAPLRRFRVKTTAVARERGAWGEWGEGGEGGNGSPTKVKRLAGFLLCCARDVKKLCGDIHVVTFMYGLTLLQFPPGEMKAQDPTGTSARDGDNVHVGIRIRDASTEMSSLYVSFRAERSSSRDDCCAHVWVRDSTIEFSLLPMDALLTVITTTATKSKASTFLKVSVFFCRRWRRCVCVKFHFLFACLSVTRS